MADLTVTRGDTLRLTVTVTNADGSAYDLTGATMRFTVKRSVWDDDSAAPIALYWISGGAASGITVSNPASGVATITATGTQTATLVTTAHVYDVQVSRGGDTWTVASGMLLVTADVTRTAP